MIASAMFRAFDCKIRLSDRASRLRTTAARTTAQGHASDLVCPPINRAFTFPWARR